MAKQQIVQASMPMASAPKKKDYDNYTPNPLLEEKAKEDLKTVKGVFRIFESGREGSSEKITCRKYHPSICPMFSKVMFDGFEYELPLYVARFLNGIDNNAEHIDGKIHTCSFVTHGYRSNSGEGMKEMNDEFHDSNLMVAKRTRRYGFESLEFASGM